MRAVFVNPCHPDCLHVCGTRAREFANAFARKGHQVVLLTETLQRTDSMLDPVELPAALAAHDWSNPFHLAVRPQQGRMIEAVRSGRLPAAWRAAVIAWQYFFRGGMFTDWRDASQPFLKPLVDTFHPDIVWGVFGNTDAWAIAQAVAKTAGCPWVRDIKDRWTGFIAAPFRSSLAHRFGDASTTTGLAQSLLDDAAPWFGAPGQVVYSGVPAGFVSSEANGPAAGQPFTMMLVGSIYEPASLAVLLEGINRFASTVERGAMQLLYAGADGSIVAAATRQLNKGIITNIQGFLPWSDYQRLIQQAHINLYIRIGGPAWHHKLVELLAARRPVLCHPQEIAEARGLTHQVGGHLWEAADAQAVATVLDRAWQVRNSSSPMKGDERLQLLTWDVQADRLIQAFRACGADAG